MGLLKEIELENGVAVKYHRIVSVNTITNQQNVIEVASYVSQAQREREAAAIASGEDCNVYISTKFHAAAYDESMTVETAYNWLKDQPDYDNAEDV